jgi:SAM-dependent methyltransferase
MLEKALELGYNQVFGIEPSHDAIEKARADIKSGIKRGFFDQKSYPKNYFDIICIFQTLDHMINPNETLKGCYNSLKKGGIILAINHDVSYWLIKILGDKWPIIDIEHPYLYDKDTIRRIFENNNFEIINVFPVKNVFSLGYISHLLPLPKAIKNGLKSLLSILDLDKKDITIYPGNLGIIAVKKSKKLSSF